MLRSIDRAELWTWSGRVGEGPLRAGTSSTREWRVRVTPLDVLGWAGSARLVYSVQQTRILRLRLFNCVASALLVIFNAAIAVWPMVALNIALTAINGFYIVRLLRGRHDSRSFEVVKVLPTRGRSTAPPTRLRRRHPALQPWVL
jgi:hypothetical protein